jgi:hypothetical protein
MRRYLIALPAVLVVCLATAPSSLGATTAAFQFDNTTTNFRNPATTSPGAYQSGTTPRAACVQGQPNCTWEAHEFEVKPGEENGQLSVTITWGSEDDDWDLFVYRVRANGTIDESSPVASSAQGGTKEETAILNAGPDAPIEAGKYRIVVDNWAAAGQTWKGFTTFSPFVPSNRLPVGGIIAPDTATAGQAVTLDGSPSRDPDGRIVNYAWDLDGDGRHETDAGASAAIQRTFDAGRRNLGLRVRDDRGGVGYATKTIVVSAPAAAASGASANPAPTSTAIPALPQPVRRTALDVAARQKRTTVLRRGLAATAECPRACTITAELRIAPAVARRLGLGRRSRSLVIARQSRTLRDRGFARLRLKPSGRAARTGLRRVSSAAATLRVTITPQGERAQTFTRAVTVIR